MSLRAQLTLFSALSVAAAVVIVSLVAYFATKERLRGEVDESLRQRSIEVADARGLPRRGIPPAGGFSHDPFAEADFFFQVIDDSGSIVALLDNQGLQIPVSKEDLAVAAATKAAYLRDARADGLHLRVMTSPGTHGEAVQVARSLDEVDASLGGLRRVLFGVSGGGIIVAAMFGLLVANQSLRPVARLTAAAEHVATTQDLGATIDVDRRDELGRLARSFNAMLQALNESREQQQRLVMDASHELRTPLTSLRTNIEVLIRADDLSPTDRAQLLRDVTFELDELTNLVGELVDLASDARASEQAFEDVRLDQLAATVVERAARRTGLRIELAAQPSLVLGNYSLLERAATNLVDNACKWSPPGSAIELSVGDGVFRVRDHGPGIAEEDRPHVFERFYRSDAARSKPGSGLGLSIVKQIVEAHGGAAWVEAGTGGGTVAAFSLDPIPLEMDRAATA